jgi:hypothetical protein
VGVGEREIYTDERTVKQDALDAVQQMRKAGHVMKDGEHWCVPDCPACGTYRRTPEVEMHELYELVQAKVRSLPASDVRDKLHLTYHINRVRLRELSKHPHVETSVQGTLILGVVVYIQYKVEGSSFEGVAEVLVRGLMPVAGA